MRALILAGGFGTRLRPLTYTRPKHLLPIANVAHIDHVLDLLRRHGIDRAVLLTSYLADAFDPVVKRAEGTGMEVAVVTEDPPLGTGGALRNAAGHVDGTFLALNGDILTDLDLSGLVEWHRERGAAATIWLTEVQDPSAFGVVPTGPGGEVREFVEKPSPGTAPTNHVNAGVYVLEPEVLEHIPAGRRWSAERDLFPALAAGGCGLYATAAPAYWLDVGTPGKYIEANLDAVSGRYRGPLVPAVSAGVAAGPGAWIEHGATVSSACLGPDATVRAGADVRRSVLLPGARVGPGAVVADSVVGEGAVVGPGARAVGAVIGDGDELQA